MRRLSGVAAGEQTAVCTWKTHVPRFFYKRFFNFKLSGDFDQKTIKFIDDCVAKDFCRLSMGLERVYYCRGKGVLT